MRWESQAVGQDDAGRLPGLGGTVIRRFNAPEALDTRFHEVRTKSALNRVAGAARLPFSWTVNPYRGCSHACVYCLRSDTPILLADGRTKPISDVSVGEAIYGTVRQAGHRRYARTEVLAHWSTVKPAYRVVLADGTELVASGDHRFLSAGGWKHVTGAEQGTARRPHLMLHDELLGLGGVADAPDENRQHRDGYLCGPIRGDGHLGSYTRDRRGGAASTVHRSRLAGTTEQRRFLQTVDPAVIRKRSIEGRAVESGARLGVVSIEPLGVELPMYDITTGTGDFVANGVISHNCFARPTHEYLDLDAGRDFEKEIIVKVNVPEVLRVELARPSWTGERVALGTNTDPYQWVEGRYKLMRGIWEALRDFANPCSILTKSPLLLRDVDLLKEIAAVTEVSACLSVPTLEEQAWRATEPHTPHPRARLEAVAELNREGIPTGILVAPLMPGINDAPEQVAKIVELATEAGATSIGGNTLFLRGSVRGIFLEWLREHRPDLVARYDELYARGAYLPPAERRRIERAAGAPWAGWSYEERTRHRGTARAARGATGRLSPAAEPPSDAAGRASPASGPVARQERLF